MAPKRRNKNFHPEIEPFREDPHLEIDHDKTEGPVRFLNPTRAQFGHRPDAPKGSKPSEPRKDVQFQWSSRNNRKGRHTIAISPEAAADDTLDRPALAYSPKHIAHVFWLLLTYYPVWDISWLVSWLFYVGSVVWVINSFFDLLPYIDPSTDFPHESNDAGGITAFIGATIFEMGSILYLFEAINQNRTGCFGWAVEQLYDDEVHSDHDIQGHVAKTRLRPDRDACTHHHQNRRNLVGRPRPATKTHADPDPKSSSSAVATASSSSSSSSTSSRSARSWQWWPSTHDLRTHYLHDLGFLACCAQLFGATIFWIAGFTALPGILDTLSPGLEDGVYWTPQVVGGSGFILSGFLFMLETQRKWYLPAFGTLGWHIGFWNWIGGIGFTLCPAFGYSPAYWAQYQSSCSTFWGSWAFLIGSTIQVFESLDKNPIVIDKRLQHDVPQAEEQS